MTHPGSYGRYTHCFTSLNLGEVCYVARAIEYTNHLLCEPKIMIITVIKYLCRSSGWERSPGGHRDGVGWGFPMKTRRKQGCRALRIPKLTQIAQQLPPSGFAQAGAGRGSQVPLLCLPQVQLLPLSAGKALTRFPPSMAYAIKSLFSLRNAFFLKKPCPCKRNPLRFQNIASAASF